MNSTRPAETGEHTATFPRRPESAGAARRFIERALASWDRAGLADDADLIVSELVANAVRHAHHDHIRVTVDRVDDGRVRLAVIDRNRAVPHIGNPGPEDVRGRGLPIVDALCERWGTDRLPWGKRVWAELTAPLLHEPSRRRSS